MENDFPKLKPGMAITFTDHNKLGFMVSETQIMYIHPHNGYSAIIEGWDLLGDQTDIEVPYSRIKAVYVSTDIVEIPTPYILARMAEAISNDEDPTDKEGVKLIWSRQARKDMILSDRQLIHIYNRMPGANIVVVNTSDEIEVMFDGDVLEFYNRASKGNYNTDDTWIKLNAHGNLIAFTDIKDSDISVEGVRMWAKEHLEEIKDILENK